VARVARLSCKDKARPIVRGDGKSSLITSPDVSTHFRAGLKSLWGWTSAGKPLNAISRIQLGPESTAVRLLLGRSLAEEMVPGSGRNWIAVNAVNNPPEQKYETNKNDNSIDKEFD
jgi:hypothetical protein